MLAMAASMPASKLGLFVLCLSMVLPELTVATDFVSVDSSGAKGNAIKKVIGLLQNMQIKIDAEGRKQEELFAKFQCYCRTTKEKLDKEIANGDSKTQALVASIKELTAKLEQTQDDLARHEVDKSAALKAIGDAKALREKEAKEADQEITQSRSNIEALSKAIEAITKGMLGTFLQTPAADMLRRFVMEKASIGDFNRQEVLAFLSGKGTDEQVPRSHEIVGVLKEMRDEMSRSLTESIEQEKASRTSFLDLIGAKQKELTVLTAQIETEMTRVGQLSVQIAGMKNDHGGSAAALLADMEYVAELKAGCSKKALECEEIKKVRAEELVAIAETIKVLSSDEAMELFRKTMPASEGSLVQFKAGERARRVQALRLIRLARDLPGSSGPDLDLIALALSGKKVGFEKVNQMLSRMVSNLQEEQRDDDKKKVYCEGKLDEASDKAKALQTRVTNSETVMDELEGSVSSLADDIKALKSGIEALDKSVVEATQQRKSENAEYKEQMATNAAAKEVLSWASKRLGKFYNQKEKEGSEELVQVSTHRQPADGTSPPETFDGYKKQGGGKGVMALIEHLIQALDRELADSGAAEKDSQSDYEKLMTDASAMRAKDSKSIASLENTKAAEEQELLEAKENKDDASKTLVVAKKYESSLHGECDWLLKYYDVRKQARTSEIDSLKKAASVLAGVDALLQTPKQHAFLAHKF